MMAAAQASAPALQQGEGYRSRKDDPERRARKEMRRRLRAELAAKEAAGLKDAGHGRAAEATATQQQHSSPSKPLSRAGSLRSKYSSMGSASPESDRTAQGWKDAEFDSAELSSPIHCNESPTASLSFRKRKTGNRLSSSPTDPAPTDLAAGHGNDPSAHSSDTTALRDRSSLEDSASTPPLEVSASPKPSFKRREGETKEETRRRRAARKAAKAAKAAEQDALSSPADPLNLRGSASLAWGLGRQTSPSSTSQDLVLGMRKSTISTKSRMSLAHTGGDGALLLGSSSPSSSFSTSKQSPAAVPAGASWAMASAGQVGQARSAALEEEMELLNADEDLDVQAFAPSSLDAPQAFSFSGRHGPAGGSAAQPAQGSSSAGSAEGVMREKAWGEGLEKYDGVKRVEPEGHDYSAAAPPVEPVTIHLDKDRSDSDVQESGGIMQQQQQQEEKAAGIDMWAVKADSGWKDEAEANAAHANAMLMASHVDIKSGSISDLCSRISFLTQPGPREGMFKMYIKRIKGLYGQYPTFECYTQDGGDFLLCARRRKKSQSSFYVISVDQHNLTRSSEGYIAKLRSNYVGTEYVGSNAGEPAKRNDGVSHTTHSSDEGTDPAAEHIAIRYKQTAMTKNGGPRCMSATIKDPSSMEVFDRSLVDLYKAAKIGNVNARERNSMYILRNKKPEWDTDVNGYVLDFKGRVTEASVKNFQLARWQPGEDEPDGPVLCQFGRNSSDTFALDFAYPLNAVQAFMIALSSLDIKLCYTM